MKISVADFSAPIGASVFKFCVHFQVDKVYCVLENKDTNSHFAFFKFSFLIASISGRLLITFHFLLPTVR